MSASFQRSKLIDEVQDIPVVKFAANIYNYIKKRFRLVENGVTFFETGVCRLYGQIADIDTVSKLDSTCAEYVANWKTSHPIIMTNVAERTRSKSKSIVQCGTAYISSTIPGKAFIFTLDVVIKCSEKVLDKLEPADMRLKTTRSGRNRSTQVDRQRTTEKHVQTTETSIQQCSKCESQETPQLGKECTHPVAKQKEAVGLYRLYRVVIITPFELLVSCLKTVRRFFSKAKRGQRKILMSKQSLTPEKEAEIKARRKISPRKRVKQTTVERLKNAALELFGFGKSSLKQSDIRQFFERSKGKSFSTSPNRSEDEKKRKYYESDASDDLSSIQRDLEDYDSEEDPDYVPEDPSDSEDISGSSTEGDTESDIEIEETEGMVRIKDTKTKLTNQKDKDLKSTQSNPKQEDLVEKNEKNVLVVIQDNKDSNIKQRSETKTEIKDGKRSTPKKEERSGKSEARKSVGQIDENKENTEKLPDVSRKPKSSKDKPKGESLTSPDACRPARGPTKKDEGSVSKDSTKPARSAPHRGSPPKDKSSNAARGPQSAEVNISGDVFQNISVKSTASTEKKWSPARS